MWRALNLISGNKSMVTWGQLGFICQTIGFHFEMMEAKGIEGGKKKDQELSNRQKSHGRVFDNTSGRDSIPKAHKANDPTSHPIHCPERI